MIDFFKPEDFDKPHPSGNRGLSVEYIEKYWHYFVLAADFANAKLEREGKVVYSGFSDNEWTLTPLIGGKSGREDISQQRALLIDIKPVKKCEHPISKCHLISAGSDQSEGPYRIEYKTAYSCECGAKVKPTAFEEVK